MVRLPRYRQMIGCVRILVCLVLTGITVKVEAQAVRDGMIVRVLEPRYDLTPEELSQRARTTLERSESQRMLDERDVIATPSQLVHALQAEIGKFLEDYKARHPKEYAAFGMEYVQPHHIDPRYLKFALVPSKPGDSKRHYRVAFDAAFHEHVRKRGRQFILKHSGRLWIAVGIGAASFVTLLCVYGVLHFLVARHQRGSDYISEGRISMV